jgi:ribosomal protein S18 acetylase RimI-like enzyme
MIPAPSLGSSRAANVHTLRWHGGWARIGPWRSQAVVGQVTIGAAAPPTRQVVDRCLELLRASGYARVVTSALRPADSLPFVDAGFAVRERLDLLSHDLHDIPVPARRSRRARRGDRPAVLEVDALSFDSFWKLDARSLEDARRATPAARFRVIGARRSPSVDGYAITGRAAQHGYLQRIAVHPEARRRGIGRDLVGDALRWLARHDTQHVVVNTQEANDAALALYEACGFRRMPTGLCVLGRTL